MGKMLPIRGWLVEMMGRHMPGFLHLPDEKPGCWFGQEPQPSLFSLVLIQSSQKHKCLGVDVASTFMPTWNGLYGHHQMVTATGLVNLRLGSSSTPMEEEYYLHDGSEASVRCALDKIGADLAAYALPFFAAREREVADDPLVVAGMNWLRHRHKPLFADRTKLFFGRRNRLQAVHEPILDKLKSFLRKECTRIGATKWHRQQTSILALHLLDYAQADLLQ